MFWRMQIQTHHVLQLLHKFRITRNLEGLDQVRLQPVALTPATSAQVRVLQGVALGGVVCVVRRTISPASTVGLRPPRGRSRSIAPMPSLA
jgi:hypothetical protein